MFGHRPHGGASRESKCGMANDPDLGDEIRNRELIEKLSAQAEALRCVNDSLATLIDLNLQLASERDPRALLEKVCRGARGLIGAKYGFLTVGDKTGREELLFVTSGIDIATVAAAKPVRIDAGTLARVLVEKGARARRECATVGQARVEQCHVTSSKRYLEMALLENQSVHPLAQSALEIRLICM